MLAHHSLRRCASSSRRLRVKTFLRNGFGEILVAQTQSGWSHPCRRWQSQDSSNGLPSGSLDTPSHRSDTVVLDSQSLQAPPTNGKTRPQRPGRTLVLCFDGTSNHFKDDKNTNVVQLFGMLERNRPEKQLVYYQTGIGTYAPPGFVSTVSQKVAGVLDEALAWYLQDHVMGGYKFLMDTYREGDKICLFGFSRGAYTARALAAMLYRVGLLPPRNAEQVPFAYTIFKDSSTEIERWKQDKNDPRGLVSGNFRRTFSRKVEVEFVGIWDTVSSVGLVPQMLPNTKTNKIVKHVRHALALDERRGRFEASYWNPIATSQGIIVDGGQNGLKERDRTVEEVWFAGCHGDIGGGWEGQRQSAQLSRIPLRWMIREAKKCTDAIVWNERALRTFAVEKPDSSDADGLAKYIEKEKEDALSKLHCSFKETKGRYFWTFLEAVPLFTPINLWGYDFNFFTRPHWFEARQIRAPTADHPTKVHSSVKTRIKHLPGGYTSAATWNPELTQFVDEWALPDDVK